MAKILLVDDDAAIVEMLERALTADGHVVVSTGDGQTALETARAEAFDVLLSDISMPGLDGIRLTEALLAEQSAVPVILMSAVADELARAAAFPQAKVKVLNKPVTLERLRAEIAVLL